MAFNFAHTVGTGYYYSSFHYLGYSPFSAAHDGDVKPDIACPWVSECSFPPSLAAILLGEPLGSLRGRAPLPRAGDEDRGAGNGRFYVEGSSVKFGIGCGSDFGKYFQHSVVITVKSDEIQPKSEFKSDKLDE